MLCRIERDVNDMSRKQYDSVAIAFWCYLELQRRLRVRASAGDPRAGLDPLPVDIGQSQQSKEK